jgi:hypothetical protein
MKRISLLLSVTFAMFLVGTAMGGNLDYTTDVLSGSSFPTVHKANPSPQIDQYDYDLALTHIGWEAVPDDIPEYCETWAFWVKAYNNGYEIVDCAEIIFTINGEEIGRAHVAGLYPGETRKFLMEFHVDWPQCEPFVIDGHVDWPPDENPANNDIEDEFAVGGEPDTVLQIDDGTVVNGWTWLPGYEYPDYGQAAKYPFEVGGVVKYMQWYYSCSSSYPAGHCEFFIWAADVDGNIIDNGQGGIKNMEFQYPSIYWPSYGSIYWPICMPVDPGDIYYFGCSNRQSLIAYTCIDGSMTNPSQNWYKSAGIWYEGDIGYNGDYFIRIGMELAGVMMSCDALTPVFCRGKTFYFSQTVTNNTGGNISGTMTFTAYAGYDCDPHNALKAIPKNRTYPAGETTTYYYFNVPNAAGPGQYSASVGGSPGGYDLFCCMNVDIIQCGPWRSGNSEWELVEVDRPDVGLPTVTSLAQNYPNPFNATTDISFNLAEAGNVNLSVYDITGRLVTTLVNGQMDAGEHIVSWNASNVSSGIYFLRLATADFSATKTMNLLK